MSLPPKLSRLSPFLIAAAVAGVALAGCQKKPPAYNTTLQDGDIMRQVIDPAAVELWKMAGSSDDKDLAPTTEEGWARAASLSATVAEGGNLLLMPGRVRRMDKKDEDWTKFANALTKEALASRAAAQAKNSDKLFETGADLYQACTNCHTKYLLPFLDKNGKSIAPGAPGGPPAPR